MRKRLAIITALLLVVALAGCSQLHTLVKPVSFQVASPAPSGVNARMAPTDLQARLEASPGSAVILPFADYSPYDSPSRHLEVHELLQTALQSSLRAADLKTVAAGNQVATCLLRRGVILEALPVLKKESPQTLALLREIEEGGWCESMNEKIGRRVHQNLIATQCLGEAVETQALDAGTLQAIGKAFSADYVVRGRITVYQSGLKWTDFIRPEDGLAFYFPTPEEGSLPFIGLSDLRAYEFFEGQTMSPSADTVASEKNLPYQQRSVKITPLVRLDLFIQDAHTGEVVFVNASEVRSSEPFTLSEKYTSKPYELTDRAVQKGVEAVLRPLIRSPKVM